MLSIKDKNKALWVAVVCLAINLSGLHCSSPKLVEKTCEFQSIRLPERIKPTHYDLFLDLEHEGAWEVDGQVKINITVGTLPESCPPRSTFMKRMLKKNNELPFGCNTKEIILNANYRVDFKKVSYIVDRGHDNNKQAYETIQVDEICRDTQNELTSIKLHKKLEDNSHGQLIIDFTVNTKGPEMSGLYKSVARGAIHKTNYERTSFVTHFEPASARKAFPCFDEPHLKATFDVTIQHYKWYTALANTLPTKVEPVPNSIRGTGLVQTHFERTPLMPTYLLAFSVGLYDHLESKIMDEKILLRVFTPPKEKELGQFALDTGRRAYAALQDYFEIEQPIKKIDFMPLQLGFGDAMENWGLVTFEDYLLLVKPTMKSYDLAMRSMVVCHELSHFWFGNMVTMKWWDNLWLNEAFAQSMGFMIANEIYPEYNINILFAQQVFMKGLEADADTEMTHPVQSDNLKTIKEIEGSFDLITYNKGAALMRMLEGFVGHEVFKLSLRDYINKFKFQNTEENDLWNAIEARSNVPVAKMMKNWLKQAGFPVVSVKLIGNNKISVKQERFEEKQTLQGKEQLWIIPVSMVVVRNGQSEIIKFVLSERQQEISLPDDFDPSEGHWLKLNADFGGFYRVHYEPEVMKLLEKPIRSKEMDVMDRMNMMDDMRALHSIKKVNYMDVQKFVEWFEREDSPSVLFALTNMVATLRKLSSGQSNRHLMLVDYYEKMKANPVDTVQDVQLLKSVRSELIRSNYKPVVEEAIKSFDSKGDQPIKNYELAALAIAGERRHMISLRDILKSLTPKLRKKMIAEIFEGVDEKRKAEILRNL